jgi:hypothetical protein
LHCRRREVQVRAKGRSQRHQHLAEKEHNRLNDLYCSDSEDVSKNKKECFASCFAEAVPEYRRLDVCILVQELHALLKAPQTALHDADEVLCKLIVRFLGLQ